VVPIGAYVFKKKKKLVGKTNRYVYIRKKREIKTISYPIHTKALCSLDTYMWLAGGKAKEVLARILLLPYQTIRIF
jgi:hypothetical protein